jgi:DNA-binding LacI/PurR family transcriptional regulator
VESIVRRPTIIDVAKLAGVSKATAARVVNGDATLVRHETRQRVMQAVEQLGYERNAIAGSLRTNQTKMVMLAIPDITNPFWPEVARGVQDGLERAGYATVTVNSDWNVDREQNFLALIRRNRFDGLIINPAMVTSSELKKLRIPVIVLGSEQHYPDFDTVRSATESAVAESLDYLLELGHTRIGLCAGHSRRISERTRYHSYIAFHARHGLPLDQDLIIETAFNEQAGYQAMEQFMRLRKPPTAVFAANDILAIGALRAARALNCAVPDQVSIMGMDDIYASAMTTPGLTTVAKPKYDIGFQAAQLLADRLEHQEPHPPQHLQLPCRLEIRDSTAPIVKS